MAMFKIVATTQLQMVFTVFLLGSAFRPLPAFPGNTCGWDLYRRVVVAHYSLVLIAFSAAMLLYMVWTEVRTAEAAAARAAIYARAKTFAADNEGLGSVAGRWTRLWLRGKLLVAVALSFAASVLAVVAFADGLLYRTGCHADHAGYGSGSPLGVLVMGLFALVHGFFAWVAVTKN